MTAYKTFSETDVIQYVQELGYFKKSQDLHCVEMGDGNLNLVFRVSDAKNNSLIVKQALPYARCVGESWPLTLDRARIEAEVLLEHFKISPEYTVNIIHYDAALATIVMQDLNAFEIMRGELVAGKRFPHVGRQLGRHLAQTLFYTSDFYLSAKEKKRQVARFINPDLCQITEDLFFTDPYRENERNNIFQPTETLSLELRTDDNLLAEVAELKAKFLNNTQALLHGDMHSGSLFVDDKTMKVIDAEFGFYGPMGFDVGSPIGNYLLNYCGSAAKWDGKQKANHLSILKDITRDTWTVFAKEMTELMDDKTQDLALQSPTYQARFLRSVFLDTIGYAGCELIRRTVGLAHVSDLESIQETNARAVAEANAIALGKALINKRHSFVSIEDVLLEAEAIVGA
ncbi:S-methyl-5-thioribose kinase [Marinomonas algicola]|uniref:S-methyl-5-thioribose kinase n=1 Tax=Marinomonas algicola TaxID=2773454 RepID=UPI00174C21D5|nr:S-methyl-5-thioribose kinase [Marinomonas algicola]